MARIVLTYALSDRDFVDRLVSWLTVVEGHTVEPLAGLRLNGEGLKDRAVVAINDADYVIAILSRGSWASPGFAFELGLVRSLEVALQRTVLIGVVVDEAPVPSIVGSRPTIRLSSAEPDVGFARLRATLRTPVVDVPPPQDLSFQVARAYLDNDTAVPGWAQGRVALADAVADRSLVLVLGAGVSVSAGIPPWKDLVDAIMARVFERISLGVGLASEQLAALMRSHSGASDLVLAQHARRELRTDFNRVVRDELYHGAIGTSALLSALGDLVEHDRARAALTYNFDDFFERELGRRRVKYSVVTKEGERAPSGFPVFHVHGLIRRNGYMRKDSFVLTESAFHEESLDPYRWSSLVQLSHFAHSTCLFVGVSVQDPNLRRLLEVIKKRSPEDVTPHFVFVRHTDMAHLPPSLTTAEATQAAEVIDRLREGDLNELGLQVIWVPTHDRIADLVASLA